MHEPIRFVAGIMFACIGLYALVSVFVPRWRSNWRWTNVPSGAVSNMGFALTFGAGAILLMFAQGAKDPVVLPIAGPPLIAGVPLVLVGNRLDFRRPRQ